MAINGYSGEGQHSDCRELCVEQMLRLLETGNRKPAKIMAGSRKAFLALKNSAEKIGIRIEFNPFIPALLEARKLSTTVCSVSEA